MKKEKEIPQEDLPYTVVSTNQTPKPRHSILLTAEGIKELAKRTNSGDLVRIESWDDITEECTKQTHYQRISIIKHES